MTEIDSEIAYLSRQLKAPRIRETAHRLADQAREQGWTHEHYLAAVLATEVTSRETSGAETRIRAGGFPARKTIEEFTFTTGLGIRRDQIHHLAAGAYLAEAGNIVLLGTPGTGKTHLAIALGLKAAAQGATGSCSRPRPNGCNACKPPTSKGNYPPNWCGCAATH